MSYESDHDLKGSEVRLWQLVVFEKWHQQYLDRAAPGNPFPLSSPVFPPPAAEHRAEGTSGRIV